MIRKDHSDLSFFFFFNDTATTEIYPLPQHAALPIYHSVDTVVNYNLNAATIAGVGNAGLPEATFGRTASTNLLFAGYSSRYHALQVKFDRQFTGGLATTTAYTFGKRKGVQTRDDGNLFFYINQRRKYARNDFDRPQTFVPSF